MATDKTARNHSGTEKTITGILCKFKTKLQSLFYSNGSLHRKRHRGLILRIDDEHGVQLSLHSTRNSLSSWVQIFFLILK